ncbi:hypothetical protein [Ornithinimicrobium cerasi]|uniref:Uncharacterized protein n=1 Tax=Ornithinimicrobium cerasi TaxID=2248773 RepID=A0A285VAL9_9MICO|nr:hypothetical protein [Ornithinimicrobium cerasi]SOC51129.1 hypothetical protein SAMN05421879_10139 [Ornithinimicrobium cerasi]
MSTDRDDVNEEAEGPGAQKHPHADVEHWLHGNLHDEDQNAGDMPAASSTARSDEGTTLTETGQLQRNLQEDAAEHVTAAAGSSDPADDNLIQLPIGAKFGMDHKPTPQEREDLVRFAAEANHELHGQDEGENHQDAGRQE